MNCLAECLVLYSLKSCCIRDTASTPSLCQKHSLKKRKVSSVLRHIGACLIIDFSWSYAGLDRSTFHSTPLKKYDDAYNLQRSPTSHYI